MKKFITPEELPNKQESEILIILIEECSEVTQRATKMLRFGIEEIQVGQELTNKDRLSMEIGDLMKMIEIAKKLDLIDDEIIEKTSSMKEGKLKKYLQNNSDNIL